MTLPLNGDLLEGTFVTQDADKMAVSNPRFPHFCRIIRKKMENPLVDEDGYSPLDDDNEQTGAENGEEIIYEGECRSYELHTTSDRGEVITSYRGLSLPVTQDDWTERGIVPQEGDEIAVNRGAYVEYGRVIDKNPANFHGTHLVWRYGRN